MALRLSCFAILLVACGGEVEDTDGGVDSGGSGFEATITDHADPISAATVDNMFVLDVTASDTAYALDDLTLLVELDTSGGYLAAAMTLDDRDGDGLLGAGDSVLAGEMNPVHYAEEDIGQPLEVNLDYRRDMPDERRLFAGIWNAE